MELLAAVSLMVVLGVMMFQMFDKTSNVVREGSARQLLYQQAKLLTEYLERDLSGTFVESGMRPLLITVDPSPTGYDQIAVSSAMLGRDTRKDSLTFGLESNLARVGYFVKPTEHALYRYEYYSLYGSGEDVAARDAAQTPFIINVVGFKVEYFDDNTKQFVNQNWNSTVSGGGTVQAPRAPQAIRITLKLTDSTHLKEYNGWDDNGNGMIDDRDETGDNVGETFQHVVYLGDRGR